MRPSWSGAPAAVSEAPESVIPDSGRTVLVTGAAGFLAPAVCAALAADGWEVHGMTRSGYVPPGAIARRADLGDRASVRAAVAGVDAVVHLAARVHRSPPRGAGAGKEESRYRDVNVEGTRQLVDESVAAGVQRFVHFSSVKAVAEASSRPLTESDTPRPQDAYGLTKLESEQVVRAAAEATGLHAPILRLPLVYGPGVRANMLRLFQAVDRGLPLPLGSIRNRRSLAFSGNVAAAVVSVMRAPAAARETFFVSDGIDVSTPDLIEAIGRALGRPARLMRVPVPFLRAAGRLGDLLDTFVPTPLTGDFVRRLTGSLQVDISKLRALAGFTPPTTLEQGLSATAAWYRSARP